MTGLLVVGTVAIITAVLILLGAPGLFRPLVTYKIYVDNAAPPGLDSAGLDTLAATFDIRLPQVGVAQQPGLIRGYLTTSGGAVTMRVAPPPGVAAGNAVAYAGSSHVPATVVGGLVQFTLPIRPGHPAEGRLQGAAPLQLEHADRHQPDEQGHALHRGAVPLPLP